MADSVALAAAAAAGATRTIVATPHVSSQWPDNRAATISALVDELNAHLRRAGVPVEVLAGAEVALSRAAELDAGELDALRLGGGPWLLVECPLNASAPGIELGLRALTHHGHRIVLAHPERCPLFKREPRRLAALVDGGMLTSVTASAFVGSFGRTVQRFAFELLRQGLVHDVASDAHDAVKRHPGLRSVLESAGLGDYAEQLADTTPGAILSGGALPAAVVPSRSGIRARLFG